MVSENVNCILLFTALAHTHVFYECICMCLINSVKEESQVINREWVDNQACSLLQYINVIANLFIMGNYFNKLR